MVYKEVLGSLLKNYKFIPRILGSSFSLFRSGEKSYSFPLRVQIENSTVCNLACQMCPLENLTRPKGFMGFSEFKKIYDILKPPFLNLTGYGESFLNKDIFKMVKYAKSHGTYVKFDSNGTLLTPGNIEKTLNSKVDLISFSLDGATKRIYEKIRVGSDFEKVIDGIKKLVEFRNTHKSSLKIHLAMVVQLDNVAQLLPLIKLGEKLGVDKVNPTPVVEYDLKKNKKFLLNKYKKELGKALGEYREKKNGLKVEVDISPLNDFMEGGKNMNKVCFIPWYSAYISWQGDVYPCCYYYDGQITFGNIFEKPFKEIWNSYKYKKFRKTLRDKRNTLPICAGCSTDEKFFTEKLKMTRKIPMINKLSKRNF